MVSSITEGTMIHHLVIVLLLLWLLNSFDYCHPFAYFASLVYIYLVHESYVIRLRRRLQFEEKRQSYQRRVLTDSESVRWLNHALEKIWPVCMEHIVSQKILLPIIPWFMQKYKPWTVKDIDVQHLYLGRCPPMFTEMRVLHQSTGDDHLALELGMNFCTEDMNASLAVKLRRRLGLGMRAKLHLLGMHVEGKVLVGVKFLPKWPFLDRLRVCFAEPPYFQMTVKPIFSHGLDVTELPGIAGWLDKLLTIAFEQTLVEPNMLVVDVKKFASPEPENWFTVDAKETIAHVVVQVFEAAGLKPSDLNGLADPYLKGRLGPYRFRTKTQKKTLTPKWQEEFKIPVCSWESPNDELKIEVCDKDHIVDDSLGECSIKVTDFRDGQRHDMWLALKNIKMGRLHLAITVIEGDKKDVEMDDEGTVDDEQNRDSFENDAADVGPPSELPDKAPKVADRYEPIDIEGQEETGVWVHHPGVEIAQVWEPRKGKGRKIDGEDSDSVGSFKSMDGSFKLKKSGSSHSDDNRSDENENENGHSMNRLHRGLNKISAAFHRSPRNHDKSSNLDEPAPSPHINLKALNTKNIGVTFVVDDTDAQSPERRSKEDAQSPARRSKEDAKECQEGDEQDSPTKGNIKDRAKNMLKHVGRSAHGGIKHVLSRKGSRKSKTESELTPSERDNSVVSDSSDESSVLSSVGTPKVVPDSVVHDTSPPGNDSTKSSDYITETSNETAFTENKPVDRVGHEDACVMDDNPLPGAQKVNDLESSQDSKIPLENVTE
ncbi:C2 domain-containing protein At1g53590 isoform X4 [Ipomoea triloba]|uniref:C2 domain-containing protein At1g53590 isoform X1 n=3 Tax=Ipomoea triloba TaxID=35885 RepID=UPI00125E7ACA|nr:C2 domain-containing protein At1g53590 isoform X1 [Ipomoea triloba]XP_031102667.1 C2 domain-containing protein At1g53590 isoform X4 [Ipomoea triloba]